MGFKVLARPVRPKNQKMRLMGSSRKTKKVLSEVTEKLKIPLDRICVKTGVLCPSCQFKVEKGIVKEFEVDIMRALLELEEEMKELKEAEYIKSYDLGDLILVILKVPRGYDTNEVAKKIRQALSKKLDLVGKRLRVVLVSDIRDPRKDPSRVAAQLLAPLTVTGINIVWLPNGEEKYRIRAIGNPNRLIAPKEKLEELLSDLLGKKVEIEIERRRRRNVF